MLALDKGFGPAIFDMRRLTKYFQFFVLGTLAMKFRPKYELLMNNEIMKAALIVSYFLVLFSLTYDMPSVLHHSLRGKSALTQTGRRSGVLKNGDL